LTVHLSVILGNGQLDTQYNTVFAGQLLFVGSEWGVLQIN